MYPTAITATDLYLDGYHLLIMLCRRILIFFTRLPLYSDEKMAHGMILATVFILALYTITQEDEV